MAIETSDVETMDASKESYLLGEARNSLEERRPYESVEDDAALNGELEIIDAAKCKYLLGEAENGLAED